MAIIRSGSQAPVKGPAEYFTGDVTIEWQFSRDDPARDAGAMVRFAAGARSNWHTHPLGQTLIVVSGTGWHHELAQLVTNKRASSSRATN